MTRQPLVGFSFLLLASLWGCTSSSFPSGVGAGSPKPASADAISISPSSATVGSGDLVLSITGSNFQGARHNFSQAVWLTNANQTLLATTFVSSSQLTAVVAADLLTAPVSAQVLVQTGDPMGDLPLRKSASAGFIVTSFLIKPATITTISPISTSVGGSDLTITVIGSNFTDERLNKSLVGWSTTPDDPHCCNTWLETTFISSTQVTAIIPAALLRAPGTAEIFIETGDPQGISDGVSYPRSNSLTFTVSP